MRKSFIQGSVLLAFMFLFSSTQAQNREFYQLKIFSFDTDAQIAITENYLDIAYLPALKKQQISNIGVFKPKSDSIKKIYVLIPFQSMSQFESLEDNIGLDASHLKNGSDFII